MGACLADKFQCSILFNEVVESETMGDVRFGAVEGRKIEWKYLSTKSVTG